ncbi:50S ribosomal protein L10 [Rickettsia rickettsii]|uniref:Large ribosomal subunit protein uL10 n=2 Tax=Rickettsia rickettsii TaxID=783 RepID=RL10_RICRO|nr:50S ribosomal protein L10 [Rickettsia rickettsii]A8GQW2.1 RecName: Full=Large ribosomal subunit protein uL10; AltName: Full=50S ribosomal protein L10 [Rickettsia rickettsii str. 'Sheila Smith']B0BWA7.1 RecName: Full=Large ribosomal subunit protein uL10; AltName: Full=50S ribosomal protein L10 [Rickettsia rickettsii str. Iowa]ABV75787.1 50S ribosomal protein L10 [Rickettsia rickettsii str. 'Sheila Smith']ABY72133.1 LSU ribosomal protein L10P [Rickettsia rickettsii str. Iowa]AFB22649.1 50S ri
MLRSEKPVAVEDIVNIYKESPSIIITHYHGLTVSQVSVLREALKSKEAGFKVVKNTLAKIAANQTGLNSIANLFAGPTAIVYSKEPVEMAKLVVNFAKANDNLKIIGGIVDNHVLDEHSIKELSKLLTLNELRGKIIGLLQAPATQVVGVLQAPSSSMARVIQAYASKN